LGAGRFFEQASAVPGEGAGRTLTAALGAFEQVLRRNASIVRLDVSIVRHRRARRKR
jgi:hypothetical protein